MRTTKLAEEYPHRGYHSRQVTRYLGGVGASHREERPGFAADMLREAGNLVVNEGGKSTFDLEFNLHDIEAVEIREKLAESCVSDEFERGGLGRSTGVTLWRAETQNIRNAIFH